MFPNLDTIQTHIFGAAANVPVDFTLQIDIRGIRIEIACHN